MKKTHLKTLKPWLWLAPHRLKYFWCNFIKFSIIFADIFGNETWLFIWFQYILGPNRIIKKQKANFAGKLAIYSNKPYFAHIWLSSISYSTITNKRWKLPSYLRKYNVDISPRPFLDFPMNIPLTKISLRLSTLAVPSIRFPEYLKSGNFYWQILLLGIASLN